MTTDAEVRTVAWDDADAVTLRAAMDAEVRPRYADREALVPLPAGMHVDPATLLWTGVAFVGGRAVGHVALRRLRDDVELKRMFVHADARGTGVAPLLLATAEHVAREAGFERIILQTGDRQPEAAALYTRAGYARIPIFDPYLTMTFSLCFAKPLDALVGGDQR